MGQRVDQLEKIKDLLRKKKLQSLQGIADHLGIGDRMAQMYLSDLSGLTSFTHRGRFVTLPDIPKFDKYGIWSYQKVGFSKFGSSLNTIIKLIEQSKDGFSRDELEAILKIGITKQIQILIEREAIHRVKLGNKYLYLPETIIRNKKKRLKLVGERQSEEHFGRDIKITDLIAVLKAVLIEKNVGIDTKSLQTITRKYDLKIPERQLERVLQKYDLTVKKKPST